MNIEDCVKVITLNEETEEIQIEFKDEQTPEMVECIKEFILSTIRS